MSLTHFTQSEWRELQRRKMKNEKWREKKMNIYRLSHVDGQGRHIQDYIKASGPSSAIAQFKRKYNLHWNAHVLTDLVRRDENESEN